MNAGIPAGISFCGVVNWTSAYLEWPEEDLRTGLMDPFILTLLPAA